MSRPSLYTDNVLNEITDRLSKGEPLAQICRDEGMPSYSTVFSWQQTKPEVSEAIARARDEGEEIIASNTRNIARGLEGSTNDVQRDKLIIDTDLKLLAKWNPKKYGDKTDLNLNGNLSLSGIPEDALAAAIKASAAEAGIVIADAGGGAKEE